MNYFSIIHKHIPPVHPAYQTYVVHVTQVTGVALQIAGKAGLSKTSKKFIEEAGMLHDIGIVYTHAPDLGCTGKLPYVMHVLEGRNILEAEGLPGHAKVAENHFGVGGIKAAEIVEAGLPLPHRDILAETIEEKIISYADLFFSKNPERLWGQLPVEVVRKKVYKYGERQSQLFEQWLEEFGLPV